MWPSRLLSRGLIPSARAFVDSCLCSLTLCSIGSRAHFDPGRAFGLSAPSFDCVPSTYSSLFSVGSASHGGSSLFSVGSALN